MIYNLYKLDIILPFMLSQYCPNCSSEYHQYYRTAVICCDQKHTVCSVCYKVLQDVRGTCPTYNCNRNIIVLKQSTFEITGRSMNDLK